MYIRARACVCVSVHLRVALYSHGCLLPPPPPPPPTTTMDQGMAFAQFSSQAVADTTCKALSGLAISNRQLSVKPAGGTSATNAPAQPAASTPPASPSHLTHTPSSSPSATRGVHPADTGVQEGPPPASPVVRHPRRAPHPAAGTGRHVAPRSAPTPQPSASTAAAPPPQPQPQPQPRHPQHLGGAEAASVDSSAQSVTSGAVAAQRILIALPDGTTQWVYCLAPPLPSASTVPLVGVPVQAPHVPPPAPLLQQQRQQQQHQQQHPQKHGGHHAQSAPPPPPSAPHVPPAPAQRQPVVGHGDAMEWVEPTNASAPPSASTSSTSVSGVSLSTRGSHVPSEFAVTLTTASSSHTHGGGSRSGVGASGHGGDDDGRGVTDTPTPRRRAQGGAGLSRTVLQVSAPSHGSFTEGAVHGEGTGATAHLLSPSQLPVAHSGAAVMSSLVHQLSSSSVFMPTPPMTPPTATTTITTTAASVSTTTTTAQEHKTQRTVPAASTAHTTATASTASRYAAAAAAGRTTQQPQRDGGGAPRVRSTESSVLVPTDEDDFEVDAWISVMSPPPSSAAVRKASQ